MNFSIRFASSALLFLPSLLPAQNYRLSQTFREQGAELFLNGFPLVTQEPTGTATINTLVAPYLRQGANTLLVKYTEVRPVAAGVVPFARSHLEAIPATGEPTSVFKVDRQSETINAAFNEIWTVSSATGLDLTQRVSPDTSFTDLLVTPDAPSLRYLRKTTGPAQVQVDFTVADARLTSLPWLAAGPALDDAGRTQIRASIQAIQTALGAQDQAALLSAFSLKNQRVASAFGSTLPSVESAQQGFFTSVFTEAGYAVTPLNTATLEFTAYPGLNLIKVTGPAAAPAVSASGNDTIYSLTPYFSHDGTSWKLVE